jgi:hypothetical protein
MNTRQTLAQSRGGTGMRGPRRPLALLLGTLLLLAPACDNASGILINNQYQPLACAAGDGSTVTATIGSAGGRVAVRGHSLTVPASAVDNPTTFRITERSATHIGVEIEPHGQAFGRNATLTLSYARCGGNPAGFQNLRVVEVRPGTTEFIRVLPSAVDSVGRTVTTTSLDHLSGYLIAGT